ncbi:putative DsbA family dithiol-disulfide isomerase [Nonlabens dokdonensis]|jgi:predicted DsbA family dithiol-disulfide isomerase|uniref:DSBA thioredoxin oxdioreductase family protein-possible polyketide synthase n=2 Tax=Nonlabens dokdonensis TaxID=328515 RepID=L7W8G7_NONDD|nr:DsbA family oxidoreductase [Nonlabens dokdonensis]AGC77990.1 DSBA thioredoxin oxdioreductase family protein-possible polyketide synthase [Nonlabens dokdonensis DSW-6]PZX37060.1 putative DsbA family dithiol-disulfide isomerase [Nonlabens dokdonensis]
MKRKLKIDIISDVVCPWCTIGYKRLEKAIKNLGIEDQIELEWQPFELNPNMPSEGQNLQQHLAEKYGAGPEQHAQMQQQMKAAGAEVDFVFNYNDDMRMSNTFEAHILLEYAKEFDKQTELKMILTKSFFTNNNDVSDREILKQALQEAELNVEEAFSRLEDKETQKEIRDKQNYWKNLGVNSVPTIVFDRKSAVTGAQPVEVFEKVLQEAINESNQS